MKSVIHKSILGCSVLTILATACNSDEQLSAITDQTPANISAGVGSSEKSGVTRATDAVWAANDHIGITMLEYPLPAQRSGQPPVSVVQGYSNQDYLTSLGDGRFMPSSVDKIMYFPVNGSQVTFKAYYPYTSSLPANFVKAVDVVSQTDLASIDLMTAVHTNNSNSKDQPNVDLKFYHRLSKVIVNLDADAPIDLTGCKLVLKGMKTQADYDLMGEKLSVKDDSNADIQIPLKNNSGQGILLPRAVGEGVTFAVTTAAGGTYTATMASDLELKSGYKYTFNVKLRTTPAVITATIEPWSEGTTKSMEVVRLVTDLGTNADFKDNEQLKLYLKETQTSTGTAVANPEFALAGNFTYNETADLWTPLAPLYWENIYGDPVDFRATSVLAAKLNSTQMDDILVSDDVAVGQYKGVNLLMKHVGSKLTVELKSTDGTFTAADLKGAAVTLPNYLNSGTLNETTGTFVVGTGTGTITPENGVAIFPPQTIAKGNLLAKVVINGRTYEVKEDASDFIYQAGTAYKLILDVKKANVLISTKVVDWVEQDAINKTVQIGKATLATNEGDLKNGDQLFLYTSSAAVPGHFTYNSTANDWQYSDSSAPLYWENIDNTGLLYASITRPEINATPANNQSKDYITATPLVNDGGKTNTALNLNMAHRVAQVRIKLTSSTYTAAQLKAAKITLPGYQIGGTMNQGVYTPGTQVGTITLDSPNNTDIVTSAYLQPQTVTTGSNIVVIDFPLVGNRQYKLTHDANIVYKAGEITNLIIDIKASDLKVSVSVTDWTSQMHNLFLSFAEAAASASGFENGDQIKFYKVSGSNVTSAQTIYTYNNNAITSTSPWFRDDFQTGEKLTGVFSADLPTVASGASTFPWVCKSTGITNAHKDDIIIAAPSGTNGVINAGSANVSLNFQHVLSKVTINLFNGAGFTASDLVPSVIKLTNFKLSGTVNVVAGTATPTGTATASFSPTSITPNTVEGKGTAVASYQALVMPQVIGTVGGSKTAIATITLNGQTYNAEIQSYDFKAGENHVFNITLAKTELQISATVAPWLNGTGGSIIIQ